MLRGRLSDAGSAPSNTPHRPGIPMTVDTAAEPMAIFRMVLPSAT